MVIGTITQIAADFNVQKKLMNERTQEVDQYMRERGLSKALQRRIRAFYEYYLERKSVFNVSEVRTRGTDTCTAPLAPRATRHGVDCHDASARCKRTTQRVVWCTVLYTVHRAQVLSEVSSTLKYELCGVMFAELARDLPFFHGRDASFVALVGVQLEPFFVLTGEYVCRKGVIGMEMYWLRKGRVSLIDPALVPAGQVSHGLQLQSLRRIPAGAVCCRG